MRILALMLLWLATTGETAPLAAPGKEVWSRPVNGLQARLSFAVKEKINGTPIVVTYLELRNVSDVMNVMEIPLDHEKVRFTVTDEAGRPVEPAYGSFGGMTVPLGLIRLPFDSFLRYNIAARGAGIPKDYAAMLDLGPTHHWTFRRGTARTFYLQGSLTIPEGKQQQWSGTINLPRARIPIR